MTTAHATAVARTDPAIYKLTQSEVMAIENRQHLDTAIRKFTQERDAIDAALRNSMEERGAVVAKFRGTVLAQLVPGSRRTIDSTKLREDHPDLAEKYTKTSTWNSLKFPQA